MDVTRSENVSKMLLRRGTDQTTKEFSNNAVIDLDSVQLADNLIELNCVSTTTGLKCTVRCSPSSKIYSVKEALYKALGDSQPLDLHFAGNPAPDFESPHSLGMVDGAEVEHAVVVFFSTSGAELDADPGHWPYVPLFVEHGELAFFSDPTLQKRREAPPACNHSVVWGHVVVPSVGRTPQLTSESPSWSGAALLTAQGYISCKGLITKAEWMTRFAYSKQALERANRGELDVQHLNARLRSGDSRTDWGQPTQLGVIPLEHEGEVDKRQVVCVNMSEARGTGWSPVLEMRWVRGVRQLAPSVSTNLSENCVSILFSQEMAQPMIEHNITDGMRSWYSIPGDVEHFEVVILFEHYKDAKSFVSIVREHCPHTDQIAEQKAEEDGQFSCHEGCSEGGMICKRGWLMTYVHNRSIASDDFCC